MPTACTLDAWFVEISLGRFSIYLGIGPRGKLLERLFFMSL